MIKKINLALDVTILILFFMAVYFILTRIFGHSATDLTITVTLFCLLGSMLYKLNREVGEFKLNVVHSFEKIGEDLKEIKKRK